MDAVLAKRSSAAWLLKNSQFEPDRKYLGMSGISKCPLRLFRECFLGRRAEINEQTARNCYRGYLFEWDAHERLAAAGIYRPGSEKLVVAPFDGRFRGHTDGETVDGDLLEIKSTNSEIFARIIHTHRPAPEHFDQVQMYMRYGPYRHALIAYINTETFSEFFAEVNPSPDHQAVLEAKARSILTAIDGGDQPACTCGRCFQSKGA